MIYNLYGVEIEVMKIKDDTFMVSEGIQYIIEKGKTNHVYVLNEIVPEHNVLKTYHLITGESCILRINECEFITAQEIKNKIEGSQ